MNKGTIISNGQSGFNQLGDSMENAIEKGTAVIDWFSFTFDGVHIDGDIGSMLRGFLQDWLCSPICGDDGNGLYGFEHSVQFQTVRLGELLPVAVVAWGGKNQKNKIYVSINGSGCSLINDWRKPKRFVESVEATITRVDVAVDALHGEFTLDTAQQANQKGAIQHRLQLSRSNGDDRRH